MFSILTKAFYCLVSKWAIGSFFCSTSTNIFTDRLNGGYKTAWQYYSLRTIGNLPYVAAVSLQLCMDDSLTIADTNRRESTVSDAVPSIPCPNLWGWDEKKFYCRRAWRTRTGEIAKRIVGEACGSNQSSGQTILHNQNTITPWVIVHQQEHQVIQILGSNYESRF